LRLGNGATVASTFSERTGDANELEFIGTKGRKAFSIYKFDSFNFTPAGSYGDRVGHVIETIRQLPRAWPILRRGGDFHESYRAEWLSFAELVREYQLPAEAATVEDGIAALRVVLTAGLSANLARPVMIDQSPRAPQPVELPGRATVIEEPRPADDPSRPGISAVISTMSGFESIARTVKHLAAQTVRERIELLIVCPREDELKLDAEAVQGFCCHRVVEIGPFMSVATPNAAGVRAASAPVVVFCEDHAFPDPNWAESLLIAHRGPYAVVGPAVHNANPATLTSRADCLIGYGPWLEPVKPCEPEHLPGHNSAYKRDILLQYGDRLEEKLEAESVLHWELRARGHRLYLDPMARLAHTNFAHFGTWTSVQFHAGRSFGGARSAEWPLWKRAIYTCGSPLIPPVRLARLLRGAGRLRHPDRITPALLVVLIWGLAMDGLGQMVGYATGAGGSRRRAHEFCRVRHITDEDRQHLAAAEPAPQPVGGMSK
jgi:hypothetical protein